MPASFYIRSANFIRADIQLSAHKESVVERSINNLILFLHTSCCTLRLTLSPLGSLLCSISLSLSLSLSLSHLLAPTDNTLLFGSCSHQPVCFKSCVATLLWRQIVRASPTAIHVYMVIQSFSGICTAACLIYKRN